MSGYPFVPGLHHCLIKLYIAFSKIIGHTCWYHRTKFFSKRSHIFKHLWHGTTPEKFLIFLCGPWFYKMILQIPPFLQKPGYVFDVFAVRMKSYYLFLKFHVNLTILEYSFTKGKGWEIHKYYGGSEKSPSLSACHCTVVLHRQFFSRLFNSLLKETCNKLCFWHFLRESGIERVLGEPYVYIFFNYIQCHQNFIFSIKIQAENIFLFIFAQITSGIVVARFLFMVKLLCLSAQQLPVLLCSRRKLLGERFLLHSHNLQLLIWRWFINYLSKTTVQNLYVLVIKKWGLS